MASPWEEAKGLVSTIIKESTAESDHPPRFHWLGDHTQLDWGLKELERLPHISLVQELLQLTDVIAIENPNTQEFVSSLSSQLELFYTSTHAELQSLHYYCSTTLHRHMDDQLILAAEKSYEQLVLSVIGCIQAIQSLQMALGSMPALLQVAYMCDMTCPTLFSIEEQLLNDETDKGALLAYDSSNDSDDEECQFLNGRFERSPSFQSNNNNNNKNNNNNNNNKNCSSKSSLQEARSGFLRLVMGEDPTNGPTESSANIDGVNPSNSMSTEEFIWSLGEQEEDEQNYIAQEFNTLTSSAVISLLANSPNSIQGSTTNYQSDDVSEVKLGKQQQLKQLRPLELHQTFAQHPLLPHRLHTLLEIPTSTLDIKQPCESHKIVNTNSYTMKSRSPDFTKNTAKSPTLKDHQSAVDTLYTETSDASKIKRKGKRSRNNSYEETKDGPLHSAKRRKSLEANASKMQQRFQSMVDQIASSHFIDKLDSGISNNEIKNSSKEEISEAVSSMWVDTAATLNIADHKPGTKPFSIAEVKKNSKEISEAVSSMWVDTAATLNIADHKPDTKTFSIAEVKKNSTEISPNYPRGSILYNLLTRPKAGFYKEKDNTMERDIKPTFIKKESSQGANIFSNNNQNLDICKTPERVTVQTSTNTKSKKPRGRPRRILK